MVKKYYVAINQATTFIAHIDECKELTGEEREVMKAEARFLRAYYYFNLFKQYGPIYLWYDQIADLAIKSEVIDRNTVDECVSFIEKEMYDAAQILPKTIKILLPGWAV